jgi:hypothetical protein
MKKIGLICMAVVLTLGIAGVGFGWWSEPLTIGENQVTTGEAKMIWNYDPWEHPSVAHWLVQYGPPCPEVTASWAQIDGHTFSVTFQNLYPGCYFRFQGYGRNMGTIPLKFSRCDIYPVSDPQGVAPHLFVYPQNTYISWDPDGTGPKPPPSAHSPVWGGYSDFPFMLLDDAINGVPVPGYPNLYAVPKFVLEPPTVPGDWHTAGRMAFGEDDEGCITVKVNPNAPNSIEGATCTFIVSFTFTQFNAPEE